MSKHPSLEPVNSHLTCKKKTYSCDLAEDLEKGDDTRLSVWAQGHHKPPHKRKSQSQRRKCDDGREGRVIKEGPQAKECGHLWKLDKARK